MKWDAMRDQQQFNAEEFGDDATLGGDYDVQCARCGKVLSTKEAIIEEGDEWECPECWERCNEQERQDALSRGDSDA